MFKKTTLVAVLVASTAIAPVAFAASKADNSSQQSSQTNATKPSPQMKKAEKDLTKLSTQGFTGFRDIRLARLAIFDGHTKAADTLVSKAQTALKKAAKDETAFDKAADKLVAPKSAGSRKGDNGQSSDNQNASNEQNADGTTTWVPIDGQVTLADDFVVTPTNRKAVESANKSLEKGDKAGAARTLKLAGIDVQYVSALLPIKAAMKNVKQAANDIDAKKYYEANLDLKKVEDSVAYDTVDVAGAPPANQKNAATNQNASGGSDAAKNTGTGTGTK